MESIPDEERQQDPWYQAVYDVIAVVKGFRLGSKSASVREGSMVVVGGDFNQTLEHKAGDDTATRDRTSTLQKLMYEADAGEAMRTLHCGVDAITYEQSEERQSNRSWIDYVMVSKTVLASGLVTEAGVLQHERLANSDHKLYVIELDLDTILQLGPAWKRTPDEKHSLPKLPLQEEDKVALFQLTAANMWKKLRVAQARDECMQAMERWRVGRSAEDDWNGLSDWGEVDPEVLATLEKFHDRAVGAITAAWRAVVGRLPSSTGNRRKDCWSKEYERKVRVYRTLVEVHSMWRRGLSRELQAGRLLADTEAVRLVRGRPDLTVTKGRWDCWIAKVQKAAKTMLGEMHGSWRKHDQHQMMECIIKRSSDYAAGKQKQAIASWTGKAKRSPPMRSTMVEGPEPGTKRSIVEPVELRHTTDDHFEEWMHNSWGPTEWYKGQVLAARSKEGEAARRRLAAGELTAADLEGVPERLRYVLGEMKYKYIDSIGADAHPGLYKDAGLMEPLDELAWRQFWAKSKKGIAAGPSELSVNQIWALQMVVKASEADKAMGKTGKKAAAGSDGTPKPAAADDRGGVCFAEHCFDGLRELVNAVLECGMVPSGMMRELLCPLDKVEGLVDLANKRPIGLVEMLVQALLGSQMQIVAGVWHKYTVIDPFQVGCTPGMGCESAIMNLMAKLEYSYLHKVDLYVPFNDQSKAFDTLTAELGIEAPLRRLGLPEKYLRMRTNCKHGSWTMTVTAWGPTKADWEALEPAVVQCRNTIQPKAEADRCYVDAKSGEAKVREVYGYHSVNGTTQGEGRGLMTSGRTTTSSPCY
jgi:hypothetical protein